MQLRRSIRFSGAVGVALLLSGCLVGPDYLRPDTSTPDAWHQALVRGLAPGETDLQSWWRTLGDTQLDALIDRAVGGNLDLQEAIGQRSSDELSAIQRPVPEEVVGIVGTRATLISRRCSG